MKDLQRRQELILDGSAHVYMSLRKAYMVNETYIDQYMNEAGHVKNGLRDRENKKWVNDIPQRPEYFGLTDMQDMYICERIRRSIIQQTQKVKLHIQYMMSTQSDLYFMTFTFKDDVIGRGEANLKKSIIRLLTEVSEDFIINKDYGKEGERLHYHAIIQLDKNSYSITQKHKQNVKLNIFETYEKNLGFYYAKPVRRTGSSIKRLTRYLNKLTLHTTKVKQEYISTKKGTEFQKFKKTYNELKKFYKGLTIDSLIEDLKNQTLSEKTEQIEKLNKLFNHHYEIEK